MNYDTELIFPPRLIPFLEDIRGEEWSNYIRQLRDRPVGDLERQAFIYFMAKLTFCATCQGDSLRAVHGCEQCARQALKRFRGTDQELIQQVQVYKQELLNVAIKFNGETK